ncbi:major capsid protein [Methylococcus sp. Mc7]|uniref:major capsid protein n=1 Tax=Methylococcus sp. Mc7 TaxID=2860258 RepID=UPI001C52F3C9|nr:major capsid protein [Methylococcus sp. Mc7]QXP85485.1 hypothetical protein KW115_07180 [Methylococcus sp. Mc7]
MAVSSAVPTALTEAAKDGAAIAAAGLGFLVVMAGFKYLRRAAAPKADDVEKGLVIDERDPELLGNVREYLADRAAQADNAESDGTYEYYYRNREAFEDIGEFVKKGGRHEYHDGEAGNDDEYEPIQDEKPDHNGVFAANDPDDTISPSSRAERYGADDHPDAFEDDEATEDGEGEEENEDEEGEERAAEPSEPANRSAQG